ncbi:MAG: hypothetical protein ACI89J_001394 [Hyphomicrobiaceae bacterium]|jgi:hypothetical protein
MTVPFIDVSRDSGPRFISDPRRKAPRRSVLIPGEVSFGDKSQRLICQIVDMSATGARLRVQMLLDCPSNKSKQRRDRIGLYFDHQRTNVECNVVWSSETEMGVQFCSMLLHGHEQPRSIYGSVD